MNKMPKRIKADIKKEPKPIYVPGQFTIPESFFNQLNEFTNGGYVLFYVNAKGSPEVRTQFDNDIYGLAIHNFIRYFANSVEDIQAASVNNGVSGDDSDECDNA